MKKQTMKKVGAAVCVVAMAGLLGVAPSEAAPITYEGGITSGSTVYGYVSEPSGTGSPNDDFWHFSASAGDTITLTGQRLENSLDLALYLYQGVGTDTNQLTMIGGADDNWPELPGLEGPFADPRLTMTLASGGQYTVQMWSFASGDPGCDGQYFYQLSLEGAHPVPVPASLLLLGSGLTGLVAVRRRK
ncbi:MAG: VPLPA-CTERM sorting domain-containing protein [Thermodesulfobacteriota bacterium]